MSVYRARTKLLSFAADLIPVERLAWWFGERIDHVPIGRSRWWLIERSGFANEAVSVAYEDRRRIWWEYEPETGKLHDTPWLATDYYYRRSSGLCRFTRLTPTEAKQWIARGIGARADEQLLLVRRRDQRALDLEAVL